MQGAYWLRTAIIPSLTLLPNIFLRHIVLFLGHLSFIFGAALFTAVMYFRFPELEKSIPRFVHGLLSIPQMWVPTVTAVESDPVLRGRYQQFQGSPGDGREGRQGVRSSGHPCEQCGHHPRLFAFWAFAYPTGDPIVLSALRLRESLAQVYQLYPKTKDMVINSHSMGGLLAKMQAETTGRVLWDSVFRSDADRLYARLPPDNVVKRALIFEANPRVARIVFICVPHRGSVLATNWIGSLGIALIHLPSQILTGVSNVVAAPLQRNLGLKRMPTGMAQLALWPPHIRNPP